VNLITFEIRINVLEVRALAVNVDADQNFIRQGLQCPPHEGLEDVPRHVNLSQITGSLCMGIVIVGGHEVLQPRLHHDPPKQMTVKRPAEDNL
jgi:hypothetical protein